MLLVATRQLSAQAEIVGLVGSNGTGFPAFSWSGTEWGTLSAAPPTGAPLVLVDSLGRIVDGRLGDPTQSMPWMYHLNGVEPLVDSASSQPFVFIGYLVSPGVTHAPFLPAAVPLSTEDWEALLPPVSTPREPEGSSQLDVQVWSAQRENASVTFFSVRREVRTTEPRSCARHYLEGWFLPDGPGPRSVAVSSDGDCSGKLERFRRPLGLLVRGDRVAVAVAPYGWEGAAGMELWEVVEGEVRLVDFEPAI